MALNGVKLVQELQERRAELARKVDELEALSEVGEAVSSSLDIDNVLATIAMHAVELSDRRGSIMEYSERERGFRVRSVYRTDPHVVDQLRHIRIDLEETLVGRAARERRPIAVRDLGDIELDPHLRILYDAGWRSLVAVPMLREDQIVGSLIVRRKRTGDFSQETLELLETFASQSALALLNAQLFHELPGAERRAGGGQSAQVGVPGQHVPRTPHSAQRSAGVLRSPAGADVRRHQRTSGGGTSATSTARADTSSSCSTRSWTSPRSRLEGWSSRTRRSACAAAGAHSVHAP